MQPLFGETLPQGEDQAAGLHVCNAKLESDGPKFIDTAVLAEKVNSEQKLEFPKGASPHLSSYLKARVMHSFREGNEDVDKAAEADRQSSSTVGISYFMGEASTLLNTRDMVWPNTNNKNTRQQMLFGRPSLSAGVTVTPMWISADEWVDYLFWDTIPQLKNDPLFLTIMGNP